jgi:nucleoside-diphosphate-sugar epimerase
MSLRRRLRSDTDIPTLVLVRHPEEARLDEEILVVRDYFELLAGTIRENDVVVNFAGIVGAQPTAELMRVNCRGAVQLASMAKAAGAAQFIQISSLAVYGDLETIGRQSPASPISDYGRSKLAADEALAELAAPAFTVTLLRVPILYGPGSRSKLNRLADWMGRIGGFPVASPLPTRSILHCANLSQTILALIEERKGGLRFAADPEPFRMDILAGLFDPPVRLVRVPNFGLSALRRLAPSFYRSLFSSSLIRQDALETSPNYPLRSTRVCLQDLIPNEGQ